MKAATFISGSQISQHYIPGAFSRLDFVKGAGGLVSASNVVIFGDCRGGEPGKILWFNGPTDADEVLRDGALLDMVKHAFSPGGGYVPQFIGAWRVNPGTRASSSFTASSNPMITAYAWDWGLHTNQLKRKLEAGTSSGKKLTLKFQTNEEYIVDNIEKESFEIQYTGAGSACSMDISKTQITTTVTGGPGGEDLTIAFTTYTTIEDIVNVINDQSGYTCTVITGTAIADASSELDSVSGQDIKTSAYTAHSDLQAIIDVLNDSPWIDSAEYYTSATTRTVPDNDTGWVYFTGAIDGAYTSTEWSTALAAALLEDIQFVGCSSEDASIHALIKTHCDTANSVQGKAERQAIVGGAAAETVAQVVTRAQNLASDAVMLAFPGFTHYDFDDTSKTITYSPAYYAAKLLGMMTVLAINEPATNKSVDVLQWEDDLTRAELVELIKAGVCCGARSRSGRLVTIRAITTYQGDELQRNEFSMIREALYVSRDLRTAVEESFVGKALTNNTLVKIDGVVIGKLSQYRDASLFTGDPPYWGYKKTILADQVKIEYDCYLTPPTNFIFVTSHMHVYASNSV